MERAARTRRRRARAAARAPRGSRPVSLDVRGRGLLLAVECDTPERRCARAARRCARGVIVRAVGRRRARALRHAAALDRADALDRRARRARRVHRDERGPPARRARRARARLDARAARAGATTSARFEALARDLFAFQFEHCAPYRRFCERRGRTPERVAQLARDPGGADRRLQGDGAAQLSRPSAKRTCSAPAAPSTARRGELHLDTLELYEASLLPSFRRGVLPDLAPGARAAARARAVARGSARLVALAHVRRRAARTRRSGERLRRARRRRCRSTRSSPRSSRRRRTPSPSRSAAPPSRSSTCSTRSPSAACASRCRAGSRVMETGGFKGRSRELPRDALYVGIEHALGVAPERIVNQYGMTELGSQFYDSVLCDRAGAAAQARSALDARAPRRSRDGRGRAAGAVGVVTIFDLANTGSVLAIQTADLGRAIGDGFEVIGREPGAEARGCSIAADEMLGTVSAAKRSRARWRACASASRRLRERTRAPTSTPRSPTCSTRGARRLRRGSSALADALPAVSGFSPETVREGLARGLAPYTGAALHALVRDELGGPERLDAARGPRVRRLRHHGDRARRRDSAADLRRDLRAARAALAGAGEAVGARSRVGAALRALTRRARPAARRLRRDRRIPPRRRRRASLRCARPSASSRPAPTPPSLRSGAAGASREPWSARPLRRLRTPLLAGDARCPRRRAATRSPRRPRRSRSTSRSGTSSAASRRSRCTSSAPIGGAAGRVARSARRRARRGRAALAARAHRARRRRVDRARARRGRDARRDRPRVARHRVERRRARQTRSRAAHRCTASCAYSRAADVDACLAALRPLGGQLAAVALAGFGAAHGGTRRGARGAGRVARLCAGCHAVAAARLAARRPARAAAARSLRWTRV